VGGIGRKHAGGRSPPVPPGVRLFEFNSINFLEFQMIYGYARVSTNEQDTRMQLDALNRFGAETIFQEKASSIGARPELKKLLRQIIKDDEIIVYKFDRLARSLKDLLNIIEQIKNAQCHFRSITESVDTSSPVGRLMLNILGSFAEFERQLIRERAIAGQAAAYSRGVRWGGHPKLLNPLDVQCVYDCYRSKMFTIALLADIFQVSEASIWRVIWRFDKPNAPSVRCDAPVVNAYIQSQMTGEKKALP